MTLLPLSDLVAAAIRVAIVYGYPTFLRLRVRRDPGTFALFAAHYHLDKSPQRAAPIA